MAGWSDSFPLDTGSTDGVQRLLAQAGRLATRAGTAVDGYTELHVGLREGSVEYLIDGSFLGIEAALQELHDTLPAVADALADERSEPELRAVADVLLLELATFGGDLLSVADEKIAGRPFAPALPPRKTDSAGDHRIAAYRAAILTGLAGRIAPATVLEEIHSTVEGLLRAAVPEPAYNFPVVVHQAVDRGIISQEDEAAILAMNKTRVAVKHKGAVAAHGEVVGHYMSTFPAIFLLARAVRPS